MSVSDNRARWEVDEHYKRLTAMAGDNPKRITQPRCEPINAG
jgi:hypothetical protein